MNTRSRSYLVLNVLISLALSCVIFGPNLFDLSSPIAFDVRSHVHKIGYLFHHLQIMKVPQWSPYWYEGFPFLHYYPPFFYFLGGFLSFITGSALISYKLLMCLILASNGIALFCFMLKVLKCDGKICILASLIYESNILLLMNYLYGTGPNLLGWTLMVFFLIFYLKGLVHGDKICSNDDILAFVFLVLSIYTHPFSVFFTVLAVFLFHLVKRHSFFKLIIMCVFAVIVSAYYWVPVLLTFKFASANAIYNIYSPETLNCIYLFVGLGILSYFMSKKNGAPEGLDFVFILLLLSLVQGFGLLSWLPLGSFLHGFRFLSIIMPFSCIALIFYFFHVSYTGGKYKILSIIMAVASFILLGPFSWYNDVTLGPLFKYKKDYLTADYREMLDRAKGGRMVIPRIRGGSFEGDSFVVYGWERNVETVNGPFNQGDPKFFRHTVHLEWEERWFEHPVTRTNLMEEAGAKYLFIRKGNPPFYTMEGMEKILQNDHGQLWALTIPVYRVVGVSPILLDVENPEVVSRFLNIVLIDGYKLVFIEVKDIGKACVSRFDYVMVDCREKLPRYKGKKIFLIQEDREIKVIDEGDVREIRVPFLAFDRKYFFQGKKGDERGYREFEARVYLLLYPELESLVNTLGEQISKAFMGLIYTPVEYERNSTGTSYKIKQDLKFALIKESYFPYWTVRSSNGIIVRTSQGFMLLSSDAGAPYLLEYTLPWINWAALIISAISLLLLPVGIFIVRKRDRKSLAINCISNPLL